MENIDPKAAEATHDFKFALGKACGNLLRGWRKKLDVDNSLRVELGEFLEGCKAIGYIKSGKRAFKAMQRDPGKPFLTIEDFDKDAAKALKDQDLDMEFTPSPYTLFEQGDVDAKKRWSEIQSVVKRGASLLKVMTENAEKRKTGEEQPAQTLETVAETAAETSGGAADEPTDQPQPVSAAENVAAPAPAAENVAAPPAAETAAEPPVAENGDESTAAKPDDGPQADDGAMPEQKPAEIPDEAVDTAENKDSGKPAEIPAEASGESEELPADSNPPPPE